MAASLNETNNSTRFTYQAAEIANDPRFNDLIALLQMALEKTKEEYGAYELGPAKLSMSKARYLSALHTGQDINVIWSSTSEELEKQFLPVRIPLRRGLLGYRISLIARENQAKIDRVQTLEDLKKLSIGQGIGWGDSLLYEALGVEVMRAKYGNLFAMVSMKRFDLFPRGVNEVFSEYALNKNDNPDLAIEKNLLIYYPWPYYFFFNKNDQARARRVETGLRKMIQDGSFDAIFHQYHDKAINQANFGHRRVLRVRNMLLPKETPLADSSLWFDPARK